MKFNQEVIDHLNGKFFSNGLKIEVAESEKKILYRIEYVKNLIKGKKIIHLGFTDHIPLIKDKISNNNWVHKILSENAELCIGIDIDAEAVNYVKDNFGFDNLYTHDITGVEKLNIITKHQWDYLIIGEVLEHIDNPVLFLSQIKENYGGLIKNIVITVPNAFDIANIKLLRKNTEFINTDHRYWFTPFTLAKVCMQAGFQIDHYSFCNSYIPNNRLSRFLLKRYPILREGILMVIS